MQLSARAEYKNLWTKILSQAGTVRGVGVQATELVRTLARKHQLGGEGAVALGEALVAGLLVASYCKPGERVNLNIQGSGRFGQGLVDAYPEGWVRGYVNERRDWSPADAEAAARAELGPWGGGLFSVLRTKGEEGKAPYIGTVPLLTGFLAKDLTFYWMQSEQVPSAVGLSVQIDPRTGEVGAAGGFLVQALAGASSSEVLAIERHIRELESLSESVAEGRDPIGLLSQIFESSSFVVLEKRELEVRCQCSQARVERALGLIGRDELRDIIASGNLPLVRCDFCTTEYRVSAETLERIASA